MGFCFFYSLQFSFFLMGFFFVRPDLGRARTILPTCALMRTYYLCLFIDWTGWEDGTGRCVRWVVKIKLVRPIVSISTTPSISPCQKFAQARISLIQPHTPPPPHSPSGGRAAMGLGLWFYGSAVQRMAV